MAIQFSNLASSLLASGVSSTATSISVNSASSFPSLGDGDYFYATIGAGAGSEIVKVTGISGTTFAVDRGQDDTTAVSHSAGVDVALRVTAGTLEDLRDGGQVYTAGSGISLSGNEFSLTDKSNYDTAYGWGDHAQAGYLTSYTDTNTTYSAGSGITLTGTTFSLTDKSNYDTAYGWGDHSTEGYLTSFDITTQTDSKYLRSNASDSVTNSTISFNSSSRLTGANAILDGFAMPQNPEGKHIKSPFFFNDIAYSRVRGATISVEVDGVAMTSTTSIDNMLNASGDFWNMSTAGKTTATITITNSPKNLTYGSHMGLSFGNTNWRAKNVELEYSTDNGTTWTSVKSVTNQNEEFVTGSWGMGAGVSANAFRWTLSNFNTTSMRVASLFAYNYNSGGMKDLYVTRDGGSIYGDIAVTGTVDGRDVSVDGTKLDGIAANANNYSLPFTDNSTNWNTAYGWGDHAQAGYLTSYTDTNTTYQAGNGIAFSGTTISLAKTKRWMPADQGNLSTYPKYFKVATVNKGNGGLHLKGTLSNHVEGFGACDFDLSIYGREGNDPAEIEVQGSINVASEGTGVLIVKSLDAATSYDHYDVYIALSKYTQATVDLTPEGSAEVFLPTTGTTTTPTAVGGIDAELDSIDETEGSYIVSNSVIYDNYHSGVFTNNSANWNTAYGWGDHGTQSYATETYVDTAVSDLVDSSPAALNTLNELAAALGDDENFSTTVTDSIATKLPLAGGTLTGATTIEADSNALRLYSDTNGTGVGVDFTDQTSRLQKGYFRYYHSDSASYGSGNAFIASSSEATMTFLADGKLMYKEGIYSKPATGTGAGTRKDLNWDTAHGWGNHASAGYATQYQYFGTGSGDHDTHHWNKTHAAYSNNGASPTYIVLTTNVPQDNYSMGGFTLVFQNYYNDDDEGDTVKIYGYWNPESNGGFVGFRYHASNPECHPTIQVGRDSNGKTVFLISGESSNYAQVIAKDFWTGYSASSASSSWGDSWAFSEASATTGISNLNTLTRVGITATQVSNWNTAYGWGNHASAGYLTSIPSPSNGDWWNGGFVKVGTDGVMEVGKYLDFHTADSGGNVDYDLRVTASAGALAVGGTVSATGGNSTNWNTAYGWGNHAGLYLPLAGGTMTGKISMFQNNDIFGLSGTIANYPRLSFYSSEGTHAAKTQTLSGDLIGQIDFNPHTGSSYTGGGKFSFYSTEAITSSQRGTEARIYSTKTGQSSLSYHQFKDDNLYIKDVGGATHKYWHAGNDGGGSGLDADKLDGLQASSFLRSDANDSTTGTITYTPNDGVFLRTGGNGSSDTTLWRCNANAATDNNASYGFTFKYMGTRSGNDNCFSIFSDNQSASTQIEAFQIKQDGELLNAGNKIWTAGNDGSGSSLDADLLDGQHGSYYYSAANPPPTYSKYLRSDTNDTTTGQLTIQTGAGGTSLMLKSNDSYSSGTLYGGGIRWQENDGTDIAGIRGYVNASGNHLTLGTGWLDQEVHITSAGMNVEGNLSAGGVISADNTQAMNCAHWSNGGTSTGAVKITLPGSVGSVHSMPVIEVTTYQYSSNAHVIYTISGHNWSSASSWYQTRVTSLGGPPLAVRLGHDGTNYCIIIGDTTTSWSYGSATVALKVHPSYYAGSQNLTTGWGASQITSMPSTVTAVGVGRTWDSTNDGSGSGLDADLLDGQHGSYYAPASHNHNGVYTPYDHFSHTGHGDYASTTTSELLTEALGDNAFDSKLTAHKTSWSYAGNGDLTDAGRLTELAGTSWLWWTDNSTDNVQGNITGLAIAPNTGGSAGKMFVYNNQGSSYSPGWREIWTSTSDGSGSGLDADLLDGQHGSYYLAYGNLTGTPTIPTIPSNNVIEGGTSYSGEYPMVARTSANTIYSHNGIKFNGAQNKLTVAGSVIINGGTSWHSGNDGSGSGLDADTVDGWHKSDFTHAEGSKTWSGIVANSAQARRYHVARLYGCPAHWDGNWQNIEFHVTAESYESGSLKFKLMGDYGGAGSQANMIKIYLKEVDGPMVGRFRFVLGTPVDAGWDHSGQDTFYVDLYAEAAHYSQWKIHAKTFGHGISSSNPTSGGATTVFYNSPTASNISDFSVSYNDTYTRGHKIWSQLNDGSGSGLDADLLDGQHGSYYYSSANPPPTYSKYLRSDVADTAAGTITFSAGINGFDISNGISGNNFNISGVNQLSINDPGEGIVFQGTNNVTLAAIDDAADNIMNFAGAAELRVNNNKVWHAGNDGSGSGLDADTCDGQHLGTSAAVQFGSVEYYNSTSSNIKVQVSGTGDSSSKMYWKKAGTTNLLTLDMSGNLTATGNVTAYSDRRIKENITPITGALSKVQRLTGNTYTRNDQEDTATKYAGLIAQEVEDVLPEAVREVDDGIKALDYNATIALLVESIKELKAEVDDLKSQLENK